MQHLKVSGAVRPLKWPLGVKWLTYRFASLPYGNVFLNHRARSSNRSVLPCCRGSTSAIATILYSTGRWKYLLACVRACLCFALYTFQESLQTRPLVSIRDYSSLCYTRLFSKRIKTYLSGTKHVQSLAPSSLISL